MPEAIAVKLGRKLRELRAHHALTQEELADRAGISTKYLQNLEGKTPKIASILTLEKLARAFKIKLSKLIDF